MPLGFLLRIRFALSIPLQNFLSVDFPGGMDSVRLGILVLLLGCFFLCHGSAAIKLPEEEVQALRQIAAKMRMPADQWNFSVDPCSGEGGWVKVQGRSVSKIVCDCSDNPTSCHVIALELSRQNLTGVLPEEIANLTQLRYLNLSRNYLNGSIPRVWAALPLFNLSLQGNRISGKIPPDLGRLPMIQSINLENNQLEGSVPEEIGNLTSLQRFLISGNNIRGELPPSFARLTNMTDFRVDGNPITGQIPDFIQHWAGVNRIDMQGTLMYGPVPSSISLLKNLTELRVSDLAGPDMTFPPLQNAKILTELVLRNCSISGEIPTYLGTMEYLKVLDLSFNKLTGPIPSNFELMKRLEYMYLTSNMLSGEIPHWMLGSRQINKINMDISYNHFTGPSLPSCQIGNLNLAQSFLSSENNSITFCLRRDLPCPTKPQYSSLFINCGGPKVIYEGREYEADSSVIGTSTFSVTNDRWAYSSTGDFIADENAEYIQRNTSILHMSNPDLYTVARLAPISLKYYALCLQNGNYSVGLHFAETLFTNDETFSSLGRRLFDVKIQGETVLKDFNIEEEAGGTGRPIIKNFKANVRRNTLEIHFYWAGKGTNIIPDRGSVYGPLISAISITQDSSDRKGKKGFSVGAVVASVIGASVVLIILASAYIFIKYFRQRFQASKRDSHPNFLQGRSTYVFTMEQIEAATDGFNPANKIGEGGFGSVYKGFLEDGTQVAVKQLSSQSRQGNREFLNEIAMISTLDHPNLVKLFGCCINNNQLLLIYEYMENNSLGRALFGHNGKRLELDWPTRYAICLGVAKGLTFLHEESTYKIIHRDIKATNILLDTNLTPKISDFGLAKLYEKEHTHVSTRIAGTIGYMAPEYATRGYLTDKADIYSFGVVVLEIVSGMKNVNYVPNEAFLYLIDWAFVLLEEGRLLELVDKNLSLNYSKEEALRLLHVALLCANPSPTLRPSMSEVRRMILGEIKVPTPSNNVSGNHDWIASALKKISNDSHSINIKSRNSPNSSEQDNKALLQTSTSISLSDASGDLGK